MKKQGTDKFTIELAVEGYFILEFFEDVEIEVEDIKALIEIQKKMSPDKKRPVLILTKPSTFTSLEVLKYLSDDKNIPVSKAEAFVLSSIAQRILANLYKRLNPNKRPTGYFKTKAEALKWLVEYI